MTGNLNRLIPALMLTALLLFSCGGGSESSDHGQVLWFSDLHFSPYVDPAIVPSLNQQAVENWPDILAASEAHSSFPPYGQKTNFRLLESALTDMQRNCPQPDFIIYTGDFLAHDFNENFTQTTGLTDQLALHAFIDKTLTFMVDRITHYYPDTPVYLTLGNNDSYLGDYLLQADGEFLHNSARVFSPFFHSRSNMDSFFSTYPQGGQYQINAPGNGNLRILSFNSIYFSRYAPESSDPAAMDQLAWLETQLMEAQLANEQVWLLFHTPPGIDVFATRHGQEDNDLPEKAVYLIKKDFLTSFTDIVSRHQDVVSAAFAGHIHRDAFRLIKGQAQSIVPVLVIPAITPVYGNNPAYRIVYPNPQTSDVSDYQVRYLDALDQTWKDGHQFSKAYGFQDLTGPAMDILSRNMRENTDMENEYALAYSGFRPDGEITPDNFSWYWSAQGHLDSDDYLQTVRSWLEMASNF
ncbi:MAG: metallophosphoesterase [Desulfonatronovibrio sp.]